jgi:predicted kinase
MDESFPCHDSATRLSPCFNEYVIVIMAGLPGTGKSTLARELAERTSGRIIGKDEIRHALFSTEEIEYSSSQDDYCLQIMLETATYILRKNRTKVILLDGRPFSRRYQIENVINAACRMHQSWRILECICAEGLVRQRLEGQAVMAEHPAANRNFQLYLEVRSRFETITLAKIVIDTRNPVQSCVEQGMLAIT